MMNLDCKSFEGHGNLAVLPALCGYCEDDVAFHHMRASGGRDLRIFATNLSSQRVQEFSHTQSTDLTLALAVRTAISTPFFCAAINIKGDIFADGGTVSNYPILGFGDEILDETMGLAFYAEDTPDSLPKTNAFGCDRPVAYFRSLFETLSHAQAAVWIEDAGIRARTIHIDTAGIGATDLALSAAQWHPLFTIGIQAAEALLNPNATAVPPT